MNEDRHIIWSNYDLDYEDWKDDLEADYPDLSEQERIALMYEINGDYLDDERMNLNLQLSQVGISEIACTPTPIIPHGMWTDWVICAATRSTMTAPTITSTAPINPVCGSLR